MKQSRLNSFSVTNSIEVVCGTLKKRESHPMVFDVKKHFFGKPSPQAVEVSFQLAYPDWCKLEDSDVWHYPEEVVGGFQKEQEHLLHQVLQQ